jgi:hypothetical protein
VGIETLAIGDFFGINMRRLVKEVPTYIVRYEDAVDNPLPVLKELFSFLLGVADIKGTILEQRIEKYGSTSSSSKAIYGLKSQNKPRRPKSSELYNEEQINYIKTQLKEMIHFFDYQTEAETNPEKKHAFFTFNKDETKDIDLTFTYKEHNARVMQDLQEGKLDFTKPENRKEFTINQP